MKTSKLLNIVGASVIGVASLFPSAYAKSYKSLELEAEFSGVVSPSAKVETVPEYIRDVPVHRNDNWAEENAAPIKDGPLSSSSLHISVKGKYKIGFGNEKSYFEMGPTFGLKIPFISQKKVTERNYMGAVGTDNRGFGTALTFYGLTVNGVGFWKLHCFTPGFFARVSSRGSNNPEEFFIEYSTELNELNLVNGWDRYNRLTRNDIYKVAGLLNHTIKVGIGDGVFRENSFNLFLGLTFPQVIYKTSLYDKTGASLSPTLVLGGSARQDLALKKRKK